MNKHYTRDVTRVAFIAFWLVSALTFSTQAKTKTQTRDYYKYKLKLGWFSLGSGSVSIAENDTTIDNQPMHRVNVHTSTLGLGNWLSNLDDDYEAFIHGQKLKSYRSYKDVKAGDSHWEQWNYFNYQDHIIDIKAMDHRKEQPERNWKVKLDDDTYDILGTFIYLKDAVDWRTKAVNDTVMIKTLFKKKLYRVGLKYLGTESLKHNGKRVSTHKLRLLLPDQDELKDDRPVYVWMTNDQHQHPLKVYSKLFIGSARCELESINGRPTGF